MSQYQSVGDLIEPVRVLYVNGEQAAADTASRQLETADDRIVVETETTASNAHETIENEMCDCIVAQHSPPELDGLELLTDIREERPSLPFILCTDNGSEELASEAISAGVTDYLRTEEDTHATVADRVLDAVSTRQTDYCLETHLTRMTDAFYALNRNWQFTYLNDQAEKLLGCGRDKLIGAQIWEAFPETAGTVVESAFTDAMETQTQQTIEYYSPSLDATFEIHAYPSETGLSVYFRDISERKARERELQDYREALETTLENVPLVFFSFDDEGVFTHSEGMALERIGLEPGEVVGESVFEVYADNDDIQDHCERVLDGEEIHATVETDGVVFEAWYQPVYEEIEPSGGVGIAYDLTEQKHRQQELERTRERLEIALEGANAGVWEWDLDTDEVVWHESTERFFGLEPGEFEGTYEAFVEFVPAESLETLETAIEQSLSQREPFEAEYQIERADGKRRWIRARAEFVDIAGSSRYVGIITDITDLKEREQELRKERAFVESTINALPDTFYTYDDSGTLTMYNDRMEVVTGYPPEELGAMKAWEFTSSEEREKITDRFWNVIEAGEPVQVESCLETKTGEIIPYEFTGGPLRGPDGEIEGLVGVGREITERIQYRKQLTELHETTQKLVHAPNVDAVGEIVCTAIQDVLGLVDGGLVRYDEKQGGFVPVRLTDGVVEVLGGRPDVFPEDSLPERVLETGEELIVEDVTQLNLPEIEVESPRALLAMPLNDTDVAGFLDESADPLDDRTLELARLLATQTATALERLERERELERREQRYRALAENFPNGGVFLFDTELRYQVARGQAFDRTPFTSDELEGNRIQDVFGGEFLDQLTELYRDTLDGKQRSEEMPFAGNLYQTQTTPVRDTNGEIFAGMAITQDITERKERVEQLEETKRRLEAVLDTISAAVFMKDTDGRYLLMNQECRDLLSVETDKDIAGMTDYAFFPDDAAEQFREDDREVFETGQTIEIEEEVPTEGGSRTHLTRKSPIFDESGEVYALCAVATDISELKQREREIEQFAYAASHDLREPLRVISNYLGLLERRHGDDLSADAREYIDYVTDAAQRMKDLIEGLLTYSRIDRRGEAFEPTDLNEVVSEAKANLEMAIERNNAGINIDNLPTVEADATQLVTVFQNLLDNAITYSGDESPTIDITAEHRDRICVFTVADEGIGMDPKQADRAFEIFERMHNGENDGTGIGLALCQKIIKRHGGNIWIDTEPGEGTEVHFTLPKTHTN